VFVTYLKNVFTIKWTEKTEKNMCGSLVELVIGSRVSKSHYGSGVGKLRPAGKIW